jgi:hypothetical protein
MSAHVHPATLTEIGLVAASPHHHMAVSHSLTVSATSRSWPT